MPRKKVLIQSDFALLKTGFAKNARIIITHLYKTGKYDIVHYCCGYSQNSPELKKTPWKSIGCLPSDPKKFEEIQKDPQLSKIANYGAYYLDEIIEQEKPDVYIAIQDIWGVDFAIGRNWFNKINSVIWTTLDSLPILPSAIEAAKKCKNYWVWSNFATKRLNNMGHTHVKTLHGALKETDFYPLSLEEKNNLREKFNINKNDFIIGYVFRNQLRKSVPNLLQGFKAFKDSHPDSNAKLLLHTSMEEGWPILSLAKEKNIDVNDILVTHVCKKCTNFIVKPYEGPNKSCPFCGDKSSLNSTGVDCGVNEAQLNQVYGLMDVYCHPFTSGGQEIPIQEAKLSGLVTLVTNYSCGEEMCEPDAYSIPLDWSEYREFGSNFIKASTDPDSISKNLEKVYLMSAQEKEDMALKGRNWVIDNFSSTKIGSEVEKFIDSCDKIKPKDFPKTEKKDPHAKIPTRTDSGEWIKNLYDLILKTQVNDDDEGYKYWMNELNKGASPESIEQYFRQVALKDNYKEFSEKINQFLDKDDNGKRILFVIPDNPIHVYSSTSLFKSIKESYDNYNLYVCTRQEYAPIILGNDFVHKVIPYEEVFNDVEKLESEGYFEVVYAPQISSSSYHHFGKDVVNYNTKCIS